MSMFHQRHDHLLDSDELEALPWQGSSSSPNTAAAATTSGLRRAVASRTVPVTMLRGPVSSTLSTSQRATPTTPFEGELLDFSPGLTTNGTTSERSSSTSLGWTSGADSGAQFPATNLRSGSYEHLESTPQSPAHMPAVAGSNQQPLHQQPLDPRAVAAQYYSFRWGNKENDRLVRNLKLQRQRHDDEDKAEWARKFHDDWLGRTPSPW